MFLSFFLLSSYGDHPDLHSFPTRRSSDLLPLRSLRHDRKRSKNSAASVRGLSPRRHDAELTALLEPGRPLRSEEHTSELQSQFHLVCRLLLEKNKQV